MREIFQIRLQEEQYRRMLKRYHFGEADSDLLVCMGDTLQQIAEPVMYYEPCSIVDSAGRLTRIRMADVEESSKPVGCKEGMQLAVLVSLGEKVDALQNEYVAKDQLTEGYMIECIGMELLQTAYAKSAEILWKQSGLWMGGFEFLGDKYPLEWTEDIFNLLQPEDIAYNKAYMMTPKKSVVFLTTLHRERRQSYCHVCESCSNLQCPNRQKQASHMNYGYQRIFGKP